MVGGVKMNIRQQTTLIIAHPMFAEAISDAEIMADLLIRLQLHCIEVQMKNSAKQYGLHRRMNYSDIKEALLSMKQPENLSLYLPIPEQKCRVVQIATAEEIRLLK